MESKLPQKEFPWKHPVFGQQDLAVYFQELSMTKETLRSLEKTSQAQEQAIAELRACINSQPSLPPEDINISIKPQKTVAFQSKFGEVKKGSFSAKDFED